MKIDPIEKKYRAINNFKVKCSCGHTIYLLNKDKKICTHCGKWIFRNKQDEFRYRLNLTLGK